MEGSICLPIFIKILVCILIFHAFCSSSLSFPDTCQKSENENEVKFASGNHPRLRLDLEFIMLTHETDGVKMMRKFTAGIMAKIKELHGQYSIWNGYWFPIKESKRGLEEVCEKYDTEYKEAFPYSCYTKANWCLLNEFLGKLLEQMGTIWKPSGPTVVLTEPWLGFFNPPDNDWSNSFINEMKMACETFFHHPLLGSMTMAVKENELDLKTRIINRIYYYVETNQHENLKVFFERFEWVKQPFFDTSITESSSFVHDMSRLLQTGSDMIEDTESFNWDYTLPVPRTREVIAMLWLVIPMRVRDLFPNPGTNEIVKERVQRFLQITFDNILEKNTETLGSLVRNTEKLKKLVKIDCSEKLMEVGNGLECDFSRVLDDLGKLVELIKTNNWHNSATLDLRSAMLVTFLSTGPKDFIEVSFTKLREVILDVFERFYGYAKQNDVSGLQGYMKLMPPIDSIRVGTERGCSEYFSDLKAQVPCMFQNVFREIVLYMNSLKVAPLNTKVISTTYNFLDKLRGAQLSAISAQIDQRAIEAKANLVEFVNEIKSFVSEETGQRFAALEEYFKGIADFDRRKANADIGYITGRLKSFDEAVQELQPTLEEKVTAVVIGSVVSSAVETVQRGIELIVKTIAACNPTDGELDPGAIFDAANEFAQSIVTLTRSSKLADTFKTAFEQTSSVARRLSENNEFIRTVREIVKKLPDLLKSNTDFSQTTTQFLTKYSDYDPKVQRQEITKVGTDWEVFLGEACDTLFAGGTAAAAIVQGTFAGRGDCLTTQGDISKMMEIYSEIYDYQFDLMETLATAVRAYQSQFFANRLDTNLRVLSEQDLPSEGEDEAISLNQAMLSFYLIYRIHTLQIVVQHCNYLQFKNAGEMPSVCLSAMRTLEQTEISNLIAFQPEGCTPESFKYVDIPTTKSDDDDDSSSWIDLSKLYKGEEVTFKIPGFDWLVAKKWITRADARDTAIYLSAFEVFLPNIASRDRKKSKKKHPHRMHKLSHVLSGNVISKEGRNGSEAVVRNKAASSNLIVRRNAGETREIQFKVTAKYPAPLFPGDNAIRFNLQPYRRYVFAYQENAGSCRQDTIDNPYPGNLPKICPLSSPPGESQVDPSIFSLWKLKLEAPEFDSVPQVDGIDTLKAAVRMCKVEKPSTLLKKKANKKLKLQ